MRASHRPRSHPLGHPRTSVPRSGGGAPLEIFLSKPRHCAPPPKYHNPHVRRAAIAPPGPRLLANRPRAYRIADISGAGPKRPHRTLAKDRRRGACIRHSLGFRPTSPARDLLLKSDLHKIRHVETRADSARIGIQRGGREDTVHWPVQAGCLCAETATSHSLYAPAPTSRHIPCKASPVSCPQRLSFTPPTTPAPSAYSAERYKETKRAVVDR